MTHQIAYAPAFIAYSPAFIRDFCLEEHWPWKSKDPQAARPLAEDLCSRMYVYIYTYI